MYPIYLPYFIYDANCHVSCSGQAAHLVRRYTVGGKNNRRTYFDYDVYNFSRDFNLKVDNLTIEANSNYTNHDTTQSTQNVINAIMPFDTEQLVPYSAQYLQGGFRSEKRDVSVADVSSTAVAQVRDISRHQIIKQTMSFYNHGIKFEKNRVDKKGTRYQTALLPIWLYSYLEKKRDGRTLLHYIVVNGRTGKVQGSVPINYPKLFVVSGIIQVVAILLTIGLFMLLVFV
jgi:hypothetical protein